MNYIKPIWSWLCLTGLLTASTAQATDKIRLDINVDSYAEPVSIHDFTNHWQGRFSGGRDAFLEGRAELTYQSGNQELSLLRRNDYLLDFSRETADIYNVYEKNQTPSVKRNYPIRLTASHTEADAIRFKPTIEVGHGLTVSPGFNLIKGYQLIDGQIDGMVTFRNAGFTDKDFQSVGLSVDYFYYKPQLHEDQLGWSPASPSGLGGSLDLQADWHPNPSYRFTLLMYDVYGVIRWHQAPFTHYQFDYQAEPQSHSLEGQLAIEDHYLQRLPMRGNLSGVYDWSESWQAAFHVEDSHYSWLAQLSTSYKKGNWRTGLLWEPQTQAVGLEISHPYVHLCWLTDRLNTNRAHRLGISLSILKPI